MVRGRLLIIAGSDFQRRCGDSGRYQKHNDLGAAVTAACNLDPDSGLPCLSARLFDGRHVAGEGGAPHVAR